MIQFRIFWVAGERGLAHAYHLPATPGDRDWSVCGVATIKHHRNSQEVRPDNAPCRNCTRIVRRDYADVPLGGFSALKEDTDR